MSLHALTYYERLYYLEEIHVADASVFAGRELEHISAFDEFQTHIDMPTAPTPTGVEHSISLHTAVDLVDMPTALTPIGVKHSFGLFLNLLKLLHDFLVDGASMH
jgi:hypothetical protein